LNPRPEITRMAASTCVVDLLFLLPVAKIDTLHWQPVVFVSPSPNDLALRASLCFSADAFQAHASC